MGPNSSSDNSEPLKWGFLGSGNIANDFIKSLSYLLPSGNHKIVACASQHYNDARKFATKYNIPKCYGSYEELLKDPEVGKI